MTILFQIPWWIQRWKNFEIRPTFLKVMNEKYRWFFLTHSVLLPVIICIVNHYAVVLLLLKWHVFYHIIAISYLFFLSLACWWEVKLGHLISDLNEIVLYDTLTLWCIVLPAFYYSLMFCCEISLKFLWQSWAVIIVTKTSDLSLTFPLLFPFPFNLFKGFSMECFFSNQRLLYGNYSLP